jgi:hypothetical protein
MLEFGANDQTVAQQEDPHNPRIITKRRTNVAEAFDGELPSK